MTISACCAASVDRARSRLGVLPLLGTPFHASLAAHSPFPGDLRRTSLDLRLSSAACHDPALADFKVSQLLPLLIATIQPIVRTSAEQDRVFTPEAM
jgi:hypothetical protein